jgi:hypothetical protein
LYLIRVKTDGKVNIGRVSSYVGVIREIIRVVGVS